MASTEPDDTAHSESTEMVETHKRNPNRHKKRDQPHSPHGHRDPRHHHDRQNGTHEPHNRHPHNHHDHHNKNSKYQHGSRSPPAAGTTPSAYPGYPYGQYHFGYPYGGQYYGQPLRPPARTDKKSPPEKDKHRRASGASYHSVQSNQHGAGHRHGMPYSYPVPVPYIISPQQAPHNRSNKSMSPLTLFKGDNNKHLTARLKFDG
eukprot:UN32499